MGRALSFCSLPVGKDQLLQAFRDAFASGLDLSIPAHVLDAAEHAGLDRAEVEGATQDPRIKQALREATDTAHELGVIGVPTIAIDRELFWGDDRLRTPPRTWRACPRR